jgi:hypothetical protein
MHLGIAGQFGREMSRDDWNNKIVVSKLLGWEGRNVANTAIPVENFGITGTSSPCSSRTLWTEKVARKLVIAIQTAASAR